MGKDEEEARRGCKRRDNTVEQLSSWFCQLSTQERLQVSASRLFSLSKGVVLQAGRGFVFMLMNACERLSLARWQRPEVAAKAFLRGGAPPRLGGLYVLSLSRGPDLVEIFVVTHTHTPR